MKARSAKNKGNRFEKHLVDILRETIDKNTHQTSASGSGLDKNDVRIPSINIEIEAKNQKTIHFIDWWEQGKSQNTAGNTTVLAIRNPKKPEFEEIIIVMDIGDWIELLKGNAGKVEVINNKDYDLKYKVRRLKEAANEVLKKLE